MKAEKMFSYNGQEGLQYGVLFYDVTLLVDIQDLKKGDRFPTAFYDIAEGRVTFWKNDFNRKVKTDSDFYS